MDSAPRSPCKVEGGLISSYSTPRRFHEHFRYVRMDFVWCWHGLVLSRKAEAYKHGRSETGHPRS